MIDVLIRRRLMSKMDHALSERQLPYGAGSWEDFERLIQTGLFCVHGVTDAGKRMGLAYSPDEIKWFGD